MSYERWVKRSLGYRLLEGDVLHPGDAALHPSWAEEPAPGARPNPLAALHPGDYNVWVCRALEHPPGFAPRMVDLELAIVRTGIPISEVEFKELPDGHRLMPKHLGLMGFWSHHYWTRTGEPHPARAMMKIEEQRRTHHVLGMREAAYPLDRMHKLARLYALIELQHQVDMLPMLTTAGVGVCMPAGGQSFAELRLGWLGGAEGPTSELVGAKLILVPDIGRATYQMPWPTDLIDLLDGLGLFDHPETLRLTQRKES